jgi:hypothetical protein
MERAGPAVVAGLCGVMRSATMGAWVERFPLDHPRPIPRSRRWWRLMPWGTWSACSARICAVSQLDGHSARLAIGGQLAVPPGHARPRVRRTANAPYVAGPQHQRSPTVRARVPSHGEPVGGDAAPPYAFGVGLSSSVSDPQCTAAPRCGAIHHSPSSLVRRAWRDMARARIAGFGAYARAPPT